MKKSKNTVAYRRYRQYSQTIFLLNPIKGSEGKEKALICGDFQIDRQADLIYSEDETELFPLVFR